MTHQTLGALLRDSVQRYGAKPALLISDGKEFHPVSYQELYDHARAFAGALFHLGIRKGDTVALLSENCAEWAYIDWACRGLGAILVPVYPTLPADQAAYIVRDCEAKLAIGSSSEQMAKLDGLEITRKMVAELAGLASESPLSPEVWEECIDATKPDEIATLIYTSGTTGSPKGAMLTHQAFTFLARSAQKSMPIDETDVFLSFLPMSHVYERFAGQVFPIACGSTVALSKSLMSLAGEMAKVQPTVMLCVPRFLESTAEKIQEAMRKAPPLSQKLFGLASRGGFWAKVLDPLVGVKIRARTGGRIRFFVSGGAALPPHVARFYQAFGLTVLQGYGLTETCAATCVNHPSDNDPETVGPPLEGMKLKIAEDGEILISGPGVMNGYFHLPEETAAALDSDGWFHTGDIGHLKGDKLQITDRKKDILVLANGKNVAPLPIETKLRENAFILEAVLFGDGMEGVGALVIPNYEAITATLGDAALQQKTPEELAQDPAIAAYVKNQIAQVNKSLADFEKVKRHVLLVRPFSVETGELTPTLKVKRKVVKEKYAKEVAQLQK